MKHIDLSSLSTEELKALMAKAENSLREKNQRRIMELRREAEELAQSMNMTVAEVFWVDGNKKQGSKLPPKFMNPANPNQTWTGRGKKPRWLAEALDQGESIEKFRI